MGLSKIEWTDYTFNPWWGCVKVSPACDHCYAEALSKRYGHAVWGAETDRRFFGGAHWNEPLKWNARADKEGSRLRVFCGSMCDVMEERSVRTGEVSRGHHEAINAARMRLYDLIRATPHLDWLLLTKRPQNFRRFLPIDWVRGSMQPNLWLLTTVESSEYLWRIEELLKVPAVVHGVSNEPALGPIDFSPWLGALGVNWIITGGESGGHARPTDPEWVRGIRDQCAITRTPFFFKQWGEHNDDLVRIGKKKAGRLLDGVEYSELPAVSLG